MPFDWFAIWVCHLNVKVAAKQMFRVFLEKLRGITVFNVDYEVFKKKVDNPSTAERVEERSIVQTVTSPDNEEFIREEDDCFLERFTALSWQRENKRLQASREDDSEKDKPPPPEPEIRHSSKFKISKKKWEDLYIEVLYTIRHKLGATSSGYAAYTQDLYDYARETFMITPEIHLKLMTIAEEEKPPIAVVNVTVIEAQGLEAKDPNGYSDPYCMLGIQIDPDSEAARKLVEPEENTHERDRGAGPVRRHGIRKFGASFKRRERRERSSSEFGVIPAKFIRTTSVKPATLNPNWHEKFRLDVDDIRTDRLHLDIWDHDDETSVIDAARKLNEVSNLKGLGRYFKEVAQSARTSIGDNIDDFLGCVNFPLTEVSAAGVDRWLPLQGRSQRSTIQGQIRLKMQLGTREDRGMATGEDNWREVVEHQELIWVFIEHELRLHKGATYEWAGDLPQQALTILHQHAIQGDITEVQQSICQWIAYSRKHREVHLDYSLMFQHLEELDRSWNEKEESLSMDEQTVLADSFNTFADHCMESLLHHRNLYPPTNTLAWHKLKFMLKCLSFMYTMSAFKCCCPFRSDLHVEITNTLKKGTVDWFTLKQEKHQPRFRAEDEKLKTLMNLIEDLNKDLTKAVSHYNHLFESTVKVNYTVLIYKQLERQLAEEISRRFGIQVNWSSSTNKQNSVSKINFDVPDTAMFELFLVLREFTQFKEHLPADEQSYLVLKNFHVYFIEILQRWFNLAKSKIRSRIYSSIELDKRVKTVSPMLKYTASAMDTVICFVQLKEFWRQLSWPDKAGSYLFVQGIVQAISAGTVLYCNLCFKKIQVSGLYTKPEDVELSENALAAVNNMEHVLHSLQPLWKELDIEKICQALDKSKGHRMADECRVALSSELGDAEGHALSRIYSIIEKVTEQMRPSIKKFIFHLAWAPEKLDPEKALTPLLDYLETKLKSMYTKFLEANFLRVLESIWKLVLDEISITTKSNIGKEKPIFFKRFSLSLSLLVNFFHGEGKALPMAKIHNPVYQNLEQQMSLHKSETCHLIDMYYLQRLDDQTKLFHAPFGCLTVNPYYDEVKQCVCVEVLSARDLIPCDPNGLSDPFVILELVPKQLFPNSCTFKTKVHKKTLFPYFNEYFEWPAKLENCKKSEAALSLVVMDHDYVGKNDFEGEAYVALNTLPGIDDCKFYDGTPEELVLMQPREKSEILSTLLVRTWDKEAIELLKQEKIKKS